MRMSPNHLPKKGREGPNLSSRSTFNFDMVNSLLAYRSCGSSDWVTHLPTLPAGDF